MSRVVTERIADDRTYAEAFLAAQTAHARRYYRRSGDPRLSLLLGESVTAYASEIPITGSSALGVLHLFMAELSVAVSARGQDLHRVRHHLAQARKQLEHTDNSAIAARGMINWYWLSAITAKADGDLREYGSLLRRAATDRWVLRNAEPIDYAPVKRQQVMMSQDLSQHMLLLEEAQNYRHARPLDYYRSVKRVMEFLTNQGMASSASMLEPELVSSFSLVAAKSTLISRISFLKNLAHLRALVGDLPSAKRVVAVASRDAHSAGLFGQVRQLNSLEAAISDADVRGALTTFRIS